MHWGGRWGVSSLGVYVAVCAGVHVLHEVCFPA